MLRPRHVWNLGNTVCGHRLDELYLAAAILAGLLMRVVRLDCHVLRLDHHSLRLRWDYLVLNRVTVYLVLGWDVSGYDLLSRRTVGNSLMLSLDQNLKYE